MTKFKVAATVIIVLFFLSSVAFAQEASDAESAGNWQFEMAPIYLWAISHSADQKVKGVDVDPDISFGDMFDNLNGAMTFHLGGVHKQSWGLFTDLNYISLKPEDGSTDIRYKQFLFELAAFYRLVEGDLIIDGFGGARYSSMKVKVEPSRASDFDQRKDWIDPYVGLRWKWNFADKWATDLRTDFGGFSIGSELTWNLVGLLHYKPWKHVGFFGGYRMLYQDYSTGSGDHKFSYDGYMYGPALGMDITW
jgi:hypothetical protein